MTVIRERLQAPCDHDKKCQEDFVGEKPFEEEASDDPES